MTSWLLKNIPRWRSATSVRHIFGATLLTVMVGWSTFPLAGNGIMGESVDDYGNGVCADMDLHHNVENVNGFLSNMTSGSGVTWPIVNNWQNTNVWDSDLVDSDVSASGGDLFNYDRGNSPMGIAMFSGHGFCKDYDFLCNTMPSHCCAHASDCTTPQTYSPYNQSLPGVCTKGPDVPAGKTGFCLYNRARIPVTCGSNDVFGHKPPITSLARLGESPNSGGWKGAGTNGGINFAIMDISCGLRPGLELAEIGPLFAGVHNYATVIVTTALSDTNDSADRGIMFAKQWQMHPGSSIAWSWAVSINSMSMTDGFPCGNGPNGFHGISGCGAHWVGSLGETYSKVQFLNTSETWVQAQNDANDATGAAFWIYTYICNYDCVTFPFVTP
jgi:hypothetical protein